MYKNEIKIQNPDRIVDTIKKILFNKQNQTGEGLTTWTSNQMLSRLLITPTGTTPLIEVDSMSILRWYIEKKNVDKFPRPFDIFFRCHFGGKNIHFVSTYFYDVILIGKKSTSLRGTLFDVILVSKKLTLFRCTFLDVIPMSER